MVDVVLTLGMVIGIAATTAITLTLFAIAMNWVGRLAPGGSGRLVSIPGRPPAEPNQIHHPLTRCLIRHAAIRCGHIIEQMRLIGRRLDGGRYSRVRQHELQEKLRPAGAVELCSPFR